MNTTKKILPVPIQIDDLDLYIDTLKQHGVDTTVFKEIVSYTDELDDLVISDGPRYDVKNEQFTFLQLLQKKYPQDTFTIQEQICISHCIKYKQYSDLHRNTLNNLIKKYTKYENKL